MPWLRLAPIAYEVLDKRAIPNTGQDASSYLWWIIKHYEQLPQWTLFMHAHEYHWHHSLFSQLQSMLIDVKALGLAFLNINHDDRGKLLLYLKDPLAQLSRRDHEQLRCDLLDLCTAYAGQHSHPPGAQFWVRSDRIRARPKVSASLSNCHAKPSIWFWPSGAVRLGSMPRKCAVDKQVCGHCGPCGSF